MKIRSQEILVRQIKFFIEENGREIGHATLLLCRNDLYDQPFGLLEDVFVSEDMRGKGIGDVLVRRVIEEAKVSCYKLIATSRHSRQAVHEWYRRLGFKDHGTEFRLDF